VAREVAGAAESEVIEAAEGPRQAPPQVLDGAILDALMLCFLTGLCHAEVLALRWDTIQIEKETIFVPIHKRGADPGKRTEFKELFITQEIKELLDQIPQRGEWAFPSQGRKSKSASGHLANLQDAWQRIRKHLGLPDVRIHDLRHTVASELGDKGKLSPRELKDSIGW